MTKLKTLKELNKKYDDSDKCGYTWNIEDVYDELRQAAIKWYKFILANCDVTEAYIFEYGADLKYSLGFIKHFFNLTDEDLK